MASLAEAEHVGLEVSVQAVVHVPDNMKFWAVRAKNLEEIECCKSQGLDRKKGIVRAKNLEEILCCESYELDRNCELRAKNSNSSDSSDSCDSSYSSYSSYSSDSSD